MKLYIYFQWCLTLQIFLFIFLPYTFLLLHLNHRISQNFDLRYENQMRSAILIVIITILVKLWSSLFIFFINNLILNYIYKASYCEVILSLCE